MRGFDRRGFIAATAAAGFAGVADAQALKPEWTILVFINGKNDLEPFALENYHAMAEVGSTADVNIVVEMGRPSKVRHTPADGNWSGVNRFYVKKGVPPLQLNAVQKLGKNIDMGRPQALESFIAWGVENYPARRFMLIIWNHGQGWRLLLDGGQASAQATALEAISPFAGKPSSPSPIGGFRAVSSDADTGSILYNSEIQDVLAAQFKSAKLELLGFDACLMAMLETAYAFEPSAKTLVASEDLEPGSGWDYTAWLGKLVADPKMEGTALAAAIVESYEDAYSDGEIATLSSLSLDGIRSSSRMLSRFADDLRQAGPGEIAHLTAARAQLGSYGDWYNPALHTSCDLINLLRRYEGLTSSSTLKASAANVRAALAKHVLKNWASTRSAHGPVRDPYGSEGIAIYFPESRKAFEDDSFRSGYLKTNLDRPVVFVRDETWADLLYTALGI